MVLLLVIVMVLLVVVAIAVVVVCKDRRGSRGGGGHGGDRVGGSCYWKYAGEKSTTDKFVAFVSPVGVNSTFIAVSRVNGDVVAVPHEQGICLGKR